MARVFLVGLGMRGKERIDTLLAVQSVDMRIAELESRQAEVPARRAEIAREITALDNERREREEGRERARLDRRVRETELETHQERLARYERQLNDVKTNVAYSALLTEIQGAKRSIDGLEDEILALMGLREEHEQRLVAIDQELGEKRAVAAEALAALATEESDLNRGLDAARTERRTLETGLDPSLQRLYDRLRKARRFPALVPLRGQACGACHGRMPPQVVREITHEGALVPCENCGVLVYAEPESSQPVRLEPERADAR